MEIPQFSAQLAGLSDDLPANTADFVVEEKFDGIRALVVFDVNPDTKNGRIQIWNRHGQNKGRIANTPTLVAELKALATKFPDMWKGTVLDGELAASTWNDTMHLLGSAGKVQTGISFYAFDIPFYNGHDIRSLPWEARRFSLEALLSTDTTDESVIQISKLLPAESETLAEIWARGGEGVIVKQKNAPYLSGDRKYWHKLKKLQTTEAVIIGFTGGRGKYIGQVGAVVLGQYKDDKMTKVTQISGMTDSVRYGLSAKDIGKVIEFEFQDKTEASYRHPRWLRWRLDKEEKDCTWENS